MSTKHVGFIFQHYGLARLYYQFEVRSLLGLRPANRSVAYHAEYVGGGVEHDGIVISLERRLLKPVCWNACRFKIKNAGVGFSASIDMFVHGAGTQAMRTFAL